MGKVKSPVRTWIADYKEQVRRWAEYCRNVDWRVDENMLQEYEMQKEISNLVLDRMKYFTKKFEPYLKEAYVKKFVDLMRVPVDVYMARYEDYIRENNWMDLPSGDLRSREMKFQADMMSDYNKIKDKFAVLNLDGDVVDYDIPIYSDKKMPFLMRDILESQYPQIEAMKEDFTASMGLKHKPREQKIELLRDDELFINMKDKPYYDPNKHYFEQEEGVVEFYENEFRKIQEGVTIDGVFIHPFLYWHINFFKTDLPMEAFKGTKHYDKNKKIKIWHPPLRDNEWMFTEMYGRADKQDKGLFIFGTRRAGKTTLEASYLSWMATKTENAECLVVGGAADDLKKLSQSLQIAFTNVPNAFYLPKNNDDWKNHIQFGLKKKGGSNDRILYGNIYIRNVEKGSAKASEKTAGATPDAWVCDEAGKFDLKAMYEAAIPSFRNAGRWSTVPLLVGCLTAGNKVFTDDGNLINIENLQQEDGIIGFDEESQKTVREQITHINPPQEKECYYIETNRGSKIECSFDHPILIKKRNVTETYTDKNGEKKKRRKVFFQHAEDVAIGDNVALADTVPLTGDKTMWNPYFVGVCIGGGTYGVNRCISFASEDKEIWDYIDSLGFDYTITRGHTAKLGRDYKECRFRGLNKHFREVGIYGQVKKDKDLPQDIHLYRKEDVCELVAGLFDTDGTLAPSKSNYIISLSSISEKLVDSLKLLLIRFGIHSNKRYVKPDKRERRIKYKNGYFKLDIADSKSILRFAELIPIKIGRKKSQLQELVKYHSNTRNSTDSNYEGLRFERVVKVEKVGMKPVYNLTTSTTNTYLANGIVTHNTGGNAELSSSAQRMLMNPEAHELLAMDWGYLDKISKKGFKFERTKFGIFVPGQMASVYPKDRSNLADFLEEDSEALRKVDIHITNWERATQTIKEEREAKRKDKVALNKHKMYHPFNPMECFLSRIDNPFPAKEAQEHLNFITSEGLTGKHVDIYRSAVDGSFSYKFTDALVPDFPFEGGTSNAPVIIFEDPPKNPVVDGTYTAGLDHYKYDKSSTDSLGCLTIFKRMVNINDEWADKLVCIYTARPTTIERFNENCALLLEAYGAECLQENIDTSFQQYMDAKGTLDLYMMQGERMVTTMLGRNSKQNNKYGLPPTPRNQQYLLKLVETYCNEEISLGRDDDGMETLVKGVTRINDVRLLEEIISFSLSGGNYDRIVSFGHALAWARYLDKLGIMPKVKVERDNANAWKEQIRRRNPYLSKRSNPYA